METQLLTPDPTQMDAAWNSGLSAMLAIMLIVLFVFIVIIFHIIRQKHSQGNNQVKHKREIETKIGNKNVKKNCHPKVLTELMCLSFKFDFELFRGQNEKRNEIICIIPTTRKIYI